MFLRSYCIETFRYVLDKVQGLVLRTMTFRYVLDKVQGLVLRTMTFRYVLDKVQGLVLRTIIMVVCNQCTIQIK